MEITRGIVEHYLSILTSAFIEEVGVPPEGLEGYRSSVEKVRRQATAYGELDELRIAIADLLAHPEVPVLPLALADYPFEEAEVRDILRYMGDTPGPITRLVEPGVHRDVRWVDLTLAEWRARRIKSP